MLLRELVERVRDDLVAVHHRTRSRPLDGLPIVPDDLECLVSVLGVEASEGRPVGVEIADRLVVVGRR